MNEHIRGRFPFYCARVRMPAWWCVSALVIVSVVWESASASPLWLLCLLFSSVVVALALNCMPPGTVRREPVEVSVPVSGRWRALNSPADRVPSHGLHTYGQTYAVDLVCEPEDGGRPGMAAWPLARRPEEFPGFGRPVSAPVSGVVVRVHGFERDHWSRTSWPAMAYLIVEGMVRELTGPSRILGNHVVIDRGDGTYAVLAHLRRRSVRVAKGQRVTAGEPVAECGNSGNSSEPHVHFQLMDRSSVLFGAGLPFRFDRFDVGDAPVTGVPSRHRPFTVAESPVDSGEALSA